MFQPRPHKNDPPAFRLPLRSVITLPSHLQGGALYIAILVSIVMGLTLSFFVLIGRYNQRTTTVFVQSAQLQLNLQSAFAAAQSAYFSNALNNVWIKNQVNDDSVRIKRRAWGAYELICAESKNRHQHLSQSGLFGSVMSPDTGLMVADQARALGMSGDIVLKAPCYFPKAGVKPAYIEGQSYVANPHNQGFIRQSTGMLPAISKTFRDGLLAQVKEFDPRFDSLVSVSGEARDQRFVHKTLVLEGLSALSRVRLSGNIKLICGNIEIDSTAHLDNVLIICKKARFKKGFTGKVHVIATDSVSMEEGCTFFYPSSLVLFAERSKPGSTKHIALNKNCQLFGGIIALPQEDMVNGSHVIVKLHSGSEVNGLVYSSAFAHVEGVVNASLITQKLMIQSPSAVYENHLLGCEINPGKYANILAVPTVFQIDNNLLCCERLN